MSEELLPTISGPADVRALPADALPRLAAEVRKELLSIVSRQGGHLASNLGTVELTIAMLHAFDVDRARMVWDTGHQAYVYKLLTGRRDWMQTLRQDGGCCGFLHRDESPYDLFGAGHAGTAISAALGFAAARDLAGEDHRVVAVVGDGALGCGVSLEGLNSIIETTRDFVLVLNDNRMSIAPNVGAMSRYLNRIISDSRYRRVKQRISNAVHGIPWIGPHLRRGIRRLEGATKSVLVPGALFEELGLRYIGPLDGHELPRLAETFKAIRELHEPLVIHVLTEKGHGYEPAREAPEIYHGTGSFDVAAGLPESSGSASFSSVLGRALVSHMTEDASVAPITAGMCHGTGLTAVREAFPDRLWDVGIAEEHAVVFAAGLAAAGLKPVVAIYATFMQRAMDYVFHDVCLQDLPVVFCLDRAGVVADGPTHHGILDLAFWRALPNLTVMQPADDMELERMLALALAHRSPVVIRYPKANCGGFRDAEAGDIVWGKAEVLREGDAVALWGVGREAATALAAADLLATRGIHAEVVNPRFAVPLDTELLEDQRRRGLRIVVVEDHCVEGGVGGWLRELVSEGEIMVRGWPREPVPWGTVATMRESYRLDVASLVDDVEAFLKVEPCP